MSDSAPREVYKDIKKVLKCIVIGILILAALAVLVIAAVNFKETRDQNAREAEILRKAIPFANSHQPWVFTRDDFGTESKLELWFLNDTDKHAVVKVSGKYSVFTTSWDFGTVTFYQNAGDACGFASASYANGKLSSITCGGKIYSDGPWNKWQ